MSSHYKAFIVVFVISVLALVFFRRPFAQAVGAKRFDNWRNLWLALVISVFFVTNYWAFLFVSGLVVLTLSRSETLKPAAYLLLLASAPALGEAIPGFGGINKFIEVTPQLVLAAILLLPAMVSAKHMKKIARAGSRADLLFLLWLILQIVLTIRAPSVTHTMRTALQEFLAVAPLYYVFSRYPKTFEDIRVLAAAFVLPILILSATTIPEVLRNWHFYNSVTTNWFGPLPFAYTMREGFLRASASVVNPITWGFVAMSGIGVGLAVLNDGFSRLYKYAGFALLAAGLIASLSRGPWIGAVSIVLVFVMIGPKIAARSMQLGVAAAAAGGLAMITPFGQRILNLLPFIGDQASDTIEYRQRLLEAAWKVMSESPFFGSSDYIDHSALEALRQGQGIIDIVNTYLQVGLKSGFTGLVLFIGVFACALLTLRKAMKSARSYNPRLALYCRALFATLVGITLTIFTTSSIETIPLVYWSLIGVSIALARVEEAQRTAADAQRALERQATGSAS